MKSKEKLILLTADYPYGKGETFLENEIQFLSNHFNEVLVISSSSSTDKTRKTPQNVSTQLFRSKDSLKKYLALLDLNFIKEFIRNFFTNPLKNKVAINSWLIASQLANVINSEISSNTVMYSYWLDDKALALSILKSKNNQLKVISRAHRWDIYEEEHLYQYLPFRKFLFSQLNAIFSISLDGVNYLKTKGANRVKLSRLGTIQDKKINDGDQGETLNIISVSYLIKRKRISLLLDAIALLDREGIKIKWTHFGDGPELSSLQIRSKNLKHIVADFKGFISNEVLLQWMSENANSSLLVNLSESEGIPVSMMEAMSFGIPCIGTEVGGVAEIIEESKNGFLLSPVPSAQEVVYKLSLYNDLSKEDKTLMKKYALSYWQERYNAETNFKGFCAELLAL